MVIGKYEFRRYIRTPNSEAFYIFNSEGRVGELNIHSGRCVHGSLILEQELSEDEINELMFRIDEDIVTLFDPRDDFIYTVYKATELGYYSDTLVESPFDNIKRKDLEEVKKELKRFSNCHDIARGQLSEIAVCDFFNNQGYESYVAPEKIDHMKIDVIASRENETIYVQVKFGQISIQEIKDLVCNVRDIENQDTHKKFACVVAERFPNNVELFRVNIEKEYNIELLLIHKYQIIASNPKYKRVLGKN